MFSATKPISNNINSTSFSTEEASSCVISSATRFVHDFNGLFNPNSIMVSNFNTTNNIINNSNININNNNPHPQSHPLKFKKKRSLPGNPDPDAEVIALSPKTLLATNRFVCEICNKGFQRDQNLQLHRRGHNLPWKLKQRIGNKDQIKKRAYVCPEPSCVHHHPSRALGDLTGIKKHFCRKHGEKKWKCDKCSKIYAVQSDWKAHTKTCGTREYRCDCGTLFSRKDSFVTHRAFCDALAEESARLSVASSINNISNNNSNIIQPLFPNNNNNNNNFQSSSSSSLSSSSLNHNVNNNKLFFQRISESVWDPQVVVKANTTAAACLSATALLQKAATVGAHCPGHVAATMAGCHNSSEFLATWQRSSDRLTRDFLGLAAPDHDFGAAATSTTTTTAQGLGFSGSETTWADC